MTLMEISPNTAELRAAYQAYRQACEDENLEPHTFHMWLVHEQPSGPLG